MTKKKRNEKKVPVVPPELVKELRREFENPSSTDVPDLPEFSIKDKDIVVIQKRGKTKRGEN